MHYTLTLQPCSSICLQANCSARVSLLVWYLFAFQYIGSLSDIWNRKDNFHRLRPPLSSFRYTGVVLHLFPSLFCNIIFCSIDRCLQQPVAQWEQCALGDCHRVIMLISQGRDWLMSVNIDGNHKTIFDQLSVRAAGFWSKIIIKPPGIWKPSRTTGTGEYVT